MFEKVLKTCKAPSIFLIKIGSLKKIFSSSIVSGNSSSTLIQRCANSTPALNEIGHAQTDFSENSFATHSIFFFFFFFIIKVELAGLEPASYSTAALNAFCYLM